MVVQHGWNLLMMLLCLRGAAITTAALILAACQSSVSQQSPPAEDERPNILLIVADDMGFADLSSFGGEISTPNLDQLALEGIRLTNFQTASMCSPTRAMMLTGVDAHQAGFGNMLEELSPNQKGQPGYEGYLNERVVTIATLLRDSGYRTYLSGKWHLGSEPQSLPGQRGFQRSFYLSSGGGSHFADMKPAYSPDPDARADYRKDDVKLSKLPESFQYSSQYYADELIDYFQQDQDSKAPFFALLAFTAPHWPLQAPDDAIARHAGRYDRGYDVALNQRLSRMQHLGLITAAAAAAVRPPKGRPWDQLTAEEQKVEARAMEIYAAMIDEMDRHSGRVIETLRQSGDLDNTVVIFISDNGAEGHDLDETWPGDLFPKIRRVIDASFDFSFEAMGKPGSYVLYGPNWARVGSPTSRLHKAFPTDGGTRTAAFVHYPAAFPGGRISNELVSVMDLAPTVLELAGVARPKGSYQGRTVAAMTGQSIVSHLKDSNHKLPLQPLGLELMGKRSMRLGPWKIVRLAPPYGTDEWQLFHLDTDPGELNDLAAQEPEKLSELLTHWDAYAKDNGVIVPDWVSGY